MRNVERPTIELSKHDPAAMRLITRRPIDGDRLAVTGTLAGEGHGVRIIVEYRSDSYRVVSATVDAPEGGEVTSAVLGIAVKKAAEEVLEQAWSMFSATSDDMGVAEARQASQEHRSEFNARQRRRSVDDALLRRVAEVFKAAREAEADSAVDAVAKEFTVSYKTAERYVREARKRIPGMPPARRTGKA